MWIYQVLLLENIWPKIGKEFTTGNLDSGSLPHYRLASRNTISTPFKSISAKLDVLLKLLAERFISLPQSPLLVAKFNSPASPTSSASAQLCREASLSSSHR
ncbi:hypothetical protein E2C01_030149 [Portunus trituberculatus]|uniref:Uncharacterized protein n=1 Tax=Portunus trituberculatus TaxID=210409 RepID=A0A5B7EQ56_PORTR|nr:hypothetical protein [Portunus trituberculatus]